MGKSIGSITNWPEYDLALKNRWNLEVWIDPEALRPPEPAGAKGKPMKYSDGLIRLMLCFKEMHKLPLRGAEGMLRSLLRIAGANDDIPDHSTLSRRGERLGADLGELVHAAQSGKVLLLDSTGLKAAGEGEWKARMHGAGKRRTWLKLHLAIDASTQEVVASMATPSKVYDAHAAMNMLEEIKAENPEVEILVGDGAYDHIPLRKLGGQLGVEVMAPPPSNAKLGRHPDRDEAVRMNREGGADKSQRWKARSGYHARSLAETAMGRLKGMLGQSLRAKRPRSRMAEIQAKIALFNYWTRLGMPKRSKVCALRA